MPQCRRAAAWRNLAPIRLYACAELAIGVSAFVVPALLVAFLIFGLISDSIEDRARVLSYGANVMFFLVGWHYAKQGYGILIVDSVKKRLMLSPHLKTLLRVNAYACWLAAWLNVNHALSTAIGYLGINYYTLPIPSPVFVAAVAVAAATTCATLFMLTRQWWKARALPSNGVVAYFTALYLWVAFVRINPFFLLVVPAFHSLQYLAVVWRYQLNVGAVSASPKRRLSFPALDRVWPDSAWRRLALFVAAGIVLGYLGFAAAPGVLAALFSYDEAVFGPTLFMFLLYIFINVHHYFLDNVMWRRGNPDIQK